MCNCIFHYPLTVKPTTVTVIQNEFAGNVFGTHGIALFDLERHMFFPGFDSALLALEGFLEEREGF